MKKSLAIALVVGGVILGVLLAVSYSAGMHYTSTDAFCLSCHNHDIPYNEFITTVHFKNEFGLTAQCADCHLPHEFLPKITRKMAAAKEVYGHITGVINTDERYLAQREAMRRSEIARLRSNDSAECRICHNVERMDFAGQSPVAREQHQLLEQGKTCIDCHQGIAHTPAQQEENFDL